MKKHEMHFSEKDILLTEPIFKDVYNSFTYELWIKPTASIRLTEETPYGISGISGQRYIIGPGYGQTDNVAGVGISIGTNGITLYEHTSDHLPALLTHPELITDWTHITVVYENKTPYLYVNGIFKKRGYKSQKERVHASGLFGGYNPYGFYEGSIREISLWNYAKSAEEIQKGLQDSINEQTSGLIGRWLFKEDAVLRDSNAMEYPCIKTKVRDSKVLFIISGCGVPFPPLEKGIIQSLERTVKKLHVASPNDNILHLVRTMKPDLVLVFHGLFFPLSQINEINQTGAKTAIWMSDDPYYTDITKNIVPHFQYIFTQDLSCVSYYRTLGCQHVYLLPLAADPSVFYPKTVDADYETDILFVGNAFWNRVTFFDHIAEYLSKKDVLISGLWWERLTNYSILKEKIQLGRWMTPEETANYYNGAKIVINIHRSSEDRSMNHNSENIQALSINPRTFEIAACGAFQLTDIRQDLSTLFTPDYDISTYNSPDEFIHQVEYYLHHEEDRKKIAERSLSRVRKEHSFLNRTEYILNTIFPEGNFTK